MSVAHDPHYGPWTTEEILALGEDRGVRRELMGEALGAEAARRTLIEKPFPVEVAPGALVSPKRR
ncbi:hypothetical protein [Streptomyces sp. NPDC051921]|uniref:hypothetical protein n=1 Tax=Streptomyces sp. NPDC051921 TaxID=3155806 RepID=UPI0034362351